MEKSVGDQVSRMATPDTIEADLAALWRELPPGTAVTRAIMSNLVVFCESGPTEPEDLTALAAPIADVVRLHPSRVIVLLHTRSAFAQRSLGSAAVSILTFGSERQRYAVEQIVVRSTCAAQSLPSIVRRLAMGDLPTSVWWTEDLSGIPPLDPLVTIGRQFVYDSREWRHVGTGMATVAGILGRPHTPDLVDLNWRRLWPMRHALFHCSGTGGVLDTAAADIQVRHGTGGAALAWLLVGWLSSQANPGWRAARFSVSETKQEADILEISIGERVTATMNEHHVAVTQTPDVPPFLVAVRQETHADGFAAELRTLGRDVELINAVRAAHQHLTSAA
jgi:glucose-6-phosphate dehydrogenase assembly protein OpcA